MTLSGAQLQEMARDTAASLDDVSHETIPPELTEDLIYTSYDLAGGLKPEYS